MDVPDRPEGWPGQDDRLVPGQQGPGGRQMVSPWLRVWGGPARRWRAEDKAEGGVATPKLRRRAPGAARALAPGSAAPKRLLFINQYYWPDHASTAQHLTDLAES